MKEGMIVISRAGHDKGHAMVVVSVEGDFALVCDGKHRPLDRPKRKRQKHLSPTNKFLNTQDYETNRSLRRSLAVFKLSFIKEELDLG